MAFKITVILLFVVVAFRFFSVANWGGAFIPANSGQFGSFGWSGILRGAGIVFFAFLGFDAISTTALEAKNPARAVPISIIGSIFICILLYVLVAVGLTGIVDYHLLNVSDPIGVGIDAIKVRWLAPVIKLGAIAGLTSVMLGALLALPRILYAIASDGLLPAPFQKIHPRFGTPYFATWVSGLSVALASALLPMQILGEMVSIGTLFAFILVCLAVLVKRIGGAERAGFQVACVWLIAPLGILSSLLLMAGLPLKTWLRLIIWMAVGLAFHFAYGRRGLDVKGE